MTETNLLKQLTYTIDITALADLVNVPELLEKLRETGAADLKKVWAAHWSNSFGKDKPILGLRFEWTVCPMDMEIGKIKEELTDCLSGGLVSLEFSDFRVARRKK